MIGGPPSPKVVPIRPPNPALARFRWMAEVLASPQFTDAEARILLRLALHQNIETGVLFVGFEKLAKGANQKKRKAIATIAKAAKLGAIKRIARRGRGRANSYNLEKVHACAPFSGKGARPGIESPPKRCTPVHPYREESTGGENHPTQEQLERLREKYPQYFK